MTVIAAKKDFKSSTSRCRAAGLSGLLRRDYEHLGLALDRDRGTFTMTMRNREKACLSYPVLTEMWSVLQRMQDLFKDADPVYMPFRWFVVRSASPRTWSLGGDLAFFCEAVERGDQQQLRNYGHMAVQVLHANHTKMGLPISTIALVEGDAVGGGFEAMLSFDKIFAAKDAKFGLPEYAFNLFPGMGAWSFLSRMYGQVVAKRLITGLESWTAEEYAAKFGLVDGLFERGEADTCLDAFLEQAQGSRFNIMASLSNMGRFSNPITLEELTAIVDEWVNLAMKLEKEDLRRMKTLAKVQQRKGVSSEPVAAALLSDMRPGQP